MSTLVRRFVPLLRVGCHPYTSEGVKCGVGPLVRDCGRERFLPPKTEVPGQTETPGDWAISPSLPAVLSSPLLCLEVSGCGEMTAARAVQRGD